MRAKGFSLVTLSGTSAAPLESGENRPQVASSRVMLFYGETCFAKARRNGMESHSHLCLHIRIKFTKHVKLWPSRKASGKGPARPPRAR